MPPSQAEPVQGSRPQLHENSCPSLSHAVPSSTDCQHIGVHRPQVQESSLGPPDSSLHTRSLPAGGRDSPIQQQSPEANHAVHEYHSYQQTQPAWLDKNSTAESLAVGSLTGNGSASSPRELAWETTVQALSEQHSPPQGNMPEPFCHHVKHVAI